VGEIRSIVLHYLDVELLGVVVLGIVDRPVYGSRVIVVESFHYGDPEDCPEVGAAV
jgi:hypothetical protein